MATSSLMEVEVYIPRRMDPGTIFVFEDKTSVGGTENPYVAAMSCPRCGTIGLITKRHALGVENIICTSDTCSAEYHLDGEKIIYHLPQ